MTSTAAVGPMFALVSFVCDGREQQTFRVPIDGTTTVKQLAKNALMRLSLLQKGSNLGIREIYVGSSDVKLFIHDVVVHVVNVKEERVFLVLRDKDTVLTEPQPTAPQVAPAVAPREGEAKEIVESSSQPSERNSPSPVSLTTEQQLDIVTRQLQRRSKSPAVERSPAEHLPRSFEAMRRQGNAAMPVPVPVHSPKPADCESRVSVHKKPTAKLPKRSHSDALTPEAAKVTDLSKMSNAAREEFIKKKECQDGYVWGRDAHRLFESNYTSDPDRMVRELRKRRIEGAASDTAVVVEDDERPPRPTVPRVVACRTTPLDGVSPANRKLFVDAADARAPTPKEADVPEAERPEGWGRKAALYFDPTTYHDNPSKAKLPPSVLNEPVRARRSARLQGLHQ